MYKTADKDLEILNRSSIPKDFFEANASEILVSYSRYLKENESASKTDISSKFNNSEYSAPYQLFHDIKIACSDAIQNHKVGSKAYKEIDFFYKFTTELLLRETGRMHLVLEQESNKEQSSLESQLKEDFNTISYDYNLSNGEVISHISQYSEANPYAHSYPNLYPNQAPPQTQISKQPLFTSLVNKSSLDTRQTFIADPYQLSKVVPLNKDIRTNSTLEGLLPSVSKIPAPTSQPTQILKDYFHPNWYTIYVPSWLDYRSKIYKPPVTSSLLKNLNLDIFMSSRSSAFVDTFAPNIDSRKAIVSEQLKSNIWLNHLGFKEIENIKQKYFNKTPVLPEDNTKEVFVTNTEVKQEAPKSEVKEIIVDESSAPREINIDRLVQWDPEKIAILESMKDDKEKLTKSPKDLQRLISFNLLKLNKLRQERYLSSNPQSILSPGKNETRLYNKIVKLIILSMEMNEVSTDKLSIEFSKKIPVLMSEYNGTLPGLAPNKSVPGTKSTRLPSIRGPYKKKNRQL